MNKWKNVDNSNVDERIKKTEMGQLVEKLKSLQGFLENQIKQDQNAILISELEIQKLKSQFENRKKDTNNG